MGAITLYEADGSEEVTTGVMTPQIYYQLGVVVSSPNSLNDLTEIRVVINDTGYTDPANNVSQQATYIWTPTNNWTEENPPTGNNTWGDIVNGECTEHTPLTDLSGTWKVKFMPGKVAKETTTWKATVTATSAGGSDTNESGSLSMEWYGELATNDDSFDFGTVGLSAVEVPIATPDDNKVDFTAITNGNYQLQSNSSNWYNTTHAKTVYLDWDGGFEFGQFGLKNNGYDDAGSANWVADTSAGSVDWIINGEDNEESNYSEDGNIEPIYMWVFTGPEGIMPYTYSGTYILELSNNA